MSAIKARAQYAAQKFFALRDGLLQAFDLADVFWIAGLATATYGVWQIHEPAAWIVCGVALFWMGVRS